uniref:Uncharacterized protein n=1 Tax=Nymphaea colorata TaxID=210225 RepID=A0A5K0YH13_9MAGN|nr:unnamed protein product [Nymphaea colorata]
MVMLKGVVHKLQRKVSRSKEDVKEGHFAVLATQDGFSKRFTVPLSYLSNPAFLNLLDEAEEEYGFSQQSVLTVPCHPSELESILSGQCNKERRDSSSNGRLKAQW